MHLENQMIVQIRYFPSEVFAMTASQGSLKNACDDGAYQQGEYVGVRFSGRNNVWVKRHLKLKGYFLNPAVPYSTCSLLNEVYNNTDAKKGEKRNMKKKKSEVYRNEIKSYIVRTGMTMSEVVDYLADEYGWSRSVPNLSGKLKRGSLRYGEAVELADALGYDLVWTKRR